MNPARSFEDLWIWQQARSLVKEAYSDFGPRTMASRDFGFRDQLQRAAVSIMNNIAEGFERAGNVEFARFLDIAKGSCGEVRSMYYAAEDLSYVATNVATQRRDKVRQLAAGIASLKKHVKNWKPRKPTVEEP